jgi:hypothetical protein
MDHPMGGVALGRELATRGLKRGKASGQRGWYVRVKDGVRTPLVAMSLIERAVDG